jgi:hypothetical protein
MRTRKPRINLVGFENSYGKVTRPDAPNKWALLCNVCGKEHIQTGREIQRNQKSMSCEHFKPHNWSGLERADNIMRKQYGISLEEFNTLLEIQDNSCAICAKPLDSLRRRMNIDHDHDTNKVRGLLCTGCNTGLGHLGDNVEGLKKAIAYLENPPINSLAR